MRLMAQRSEVVQGRSWFLKFLFCMFWHVARRLRRSPSPPPVSVRTERALGNKIRVGIIEDQPFYREGIILHLSAHDDMEIVGSGATADDAIRITAECCPDVIVMNMRISGGGLKIIETIQGLGSMTKILALSISGDSSLVNATMRAGARGYMLRLATGKELVQAVRIVDAGQRYLTPSLAYDLLVRVEEHRQSERSRSDPAAVLTPRERDVLTVLVEGRSNKEIGNRLDLSEKTIKHHVGNILQKLRARNRVEAVLKVSHHLRADVELRVH
jgi:two-component system nitrate/nitrite response regulator NarL